MAVLEKSCAKSDSIQYLKSDLIPCAFSEFSAIV
jgi:hypothetical protein